MRLRVVSLMPPRPCSARSTAPIETYAISAIRWIPCFSLFINRTPLLHATRASAFVPRCHARSHLDYSPNDRLASAVPSTRPNPPPLERQLGYRVPQPAYVNTI